MIFKIRSGCGSGTRFSTTWHSHSEPLFRIAAVFCQVSLEQAESERYLHEKVLRLPVRTVWKHAEMLQMRGPVCFWE